MKEMQANLKRADLLNRLLLTIVVTISSITGVFARSWYSQIVKDEITIWTKASLGFVVGGSAAK